jgi:formylglycine-generating enzyme required for sulfatase activity
MPCSHLPPSDLPDPLRMDDTHLTETVLLLARGIAADLAFDRLPILADALEDAGCDNLALLNHLRSDEPHRVECWALRRLLRITLLLPGGVPMTFAYCPPGTFLMGSSRPTYSLLNTSLRQVTIKNGFHAGIVPVTQRQWESLMAVNPSFFRGDHRPVDGASWDVAQWFCRRASEVVGRTLRLPTGTTTEYHYGDEPNQTLMYRSRHYDEGGGTIEVGQYPPNPWGLHDCHGNVWEWVEGRVDNQGKQKGLRGGCWACVEDLCRSAYRHRKYGGQGSHDTGFRVVFTA